MSFLNDRWEFINGRPVNICVTCGKDFGNEYMLIGNHPNVTNLASTIRCHACAHELQRKEELQQEEWEHAVRNSWA